MAFMPELMGKAVDSLNKPVIKTISFLKQFPEITDMRLEFSYLYQVIILRILK